MRDIHRVALKFIQGQIIIAIIIGIIETIGLYIVGMPYAIFLGFIGGISNIIPYFGPYIGAVPAVVIALTISPWKALLVISVFVIVQQLDNIILTPKIIKGKLGLHPIITIMSVLVGDVCLVFRSCICSSNSSHDKNYSKESLSNDNRVMAFHT